MVFRLHPSYAEEVWKNEEIKHRFSRYKGIINGTQIARYLIAKTIKWERKEKSTLQSKIEEFNGLTLKFRELLKENYNLLINRKVQQNSYLDLAEKIAQEYLKKCNFCERRCEANRHEGEKGYCCVPKDAYVSSAFLHYGEENVLVPSGTIFFQGCNFSCCFCQNYDLSQEWKKREDIGAVARYVDGISLANLANKLFEKGALNINYVGGDPIPNIHIIINNLKHQVNNVCQLWNSNFYLTVDSLSLILDLIDFWLPDFKYGNNECAKKYSGVNDYYNIIKRNLKIIYDEGSGEIIIRHLVMPNHVECCSKPILDFVAKEVPNCVVNIMAQYRPVYHASRYPEINRHPTSEEIKETKRYANDLGIIYKPVS